MVVTSLSMSRPCKVKQSLLVWLRLHVVKPERELDGMSNSEAIMKIIRHWRWHELRHHPMVGVVWIIPGRTCRSRTEIILLSWKLPRRPTSSIHNTVENIENLQWFSFDEMSHIEKRRRREIALPNIFSSKSVNFINTFWRFLLNEENDRKESVWYDWAGRTHRMYGSNRNCSLLNMPTFEASNLTFYRESANDICTLQMRNII